MKRITSKLTRRNLWWCVKVNVQSWILQGALVGLLSVVGVGTVAAIVSAKVTAYVVFAGQCVAAARAK